VAEAVAAGAPDTPLGCRHGRLVVVTSGLVVTVVDDGDDVEGAGEEVAQPSAGPVVAGGRFGAVVVVLPPPAVVVDVGPGAVVVLGAMVVEAPTVVVEDVLPHWAL
jgi:hypothetical protein